MIELWKFLDSKKTTIGAALFLAATIISAMAGIWAGDNPPEWIAKVIETLNWFGGMFSGVGLAHKGIKKVKSK